MMTTMTTWMLEFDYIKKVMSLMTGILEFDQIKKVMMLLTPNKKEHPCLKKRLMHTQKNSMITWAFS